MSRILIKNGRLWTDGTFCDGDILTEGKYIKKRNANIREAGKYMSNQSKTIVFTKPMTAEVIMKELRPLAPKSVKVKMEYTVISGGMQTGLMIRQ